MDNRIGTFATETSPVEWPKLDVSGARYSKPTTRHKLTDQHFVVLPPGFNDWHLLGELKSSLSPAAPEVVLSVVEETVPEADATETSDDDTPIRRRK